ncbi:DUF2336 domain-containing protein [Alkalicaulis satelles]|uniref:DUF2336 domain-containing protein n=1 Tax=Alkalicaulis satelles TaxID=2609175 RepID=A0A5M6ZN40_9PROT|nr:DUF2336 domain-containing protein [Alkalicaulis satelles]KAA5805004.1 DUF2336 domain-containing protein [Alkalicaulis satelles]
MSVHTLRARLTREDIARLTHSDEEERALAARKVCARYAGPGLTDEERELGAEIVRVLAQDAAELVRRALSVTLQRSPYLPEDVARQLMGDIDSIALPIIAGSPVLSDEDLIAIVRSGGPRRQTAVAARETLSEPLTAEIAEHGVSEAVSVLAANSGAAFNTAAYASVFNRFAHSPHILERFIERPSLPLEVTEKLVARISDAALQRLVARHALPPQLAVELAEGARERATVDLVDQAGLSSDPRRFVQQLQLNARLTPSLMLRALLRGHITFFEHAVAELAGVEHARAWVLIHDAGPLGLDAVFKKAGLPERILPAVRAALSAWHSLEVGPDGTRDLIRFRQRLMERVFTQFQGAPVAELDYCLDRLDADIAAETAARLTG